MLAHEITSPSGQLMVAGDTNHLVLQQAYDPGQYWLALGDVFLFPVRAREDEIPLPDRHQASLTGMRKRAAKPYASRVSPTGFRPLDDVQTQMIFSGEHRVSHRQWQVLELRKHPGWERVKGELCRVKLPYNPSKLAWLQEECVGWFYIEVSGHFVFSHAVDAVNFKLRWG